MYIYIWMIWMCWKGMRRKSMHPQTMYIWQWQHVFSFNTMPLSYPVVAQPWSSCDAEWPSSLEQREMCWEEGTSNTIQYCDLKGNNEWDTFAVLPEKFSSRIQWSEARYATSAGWQHHQVQAQLQQLGSPRSSRSLVNWLELSNKAINGAQVSLNYLNCLFSWDCWEQWRTEAALSSFALAAVKCVPGRSGTSPDSTALEPTCWKMLKDGTNMLDVAPCSSIFRVFTRILRSNFWFCKWSSAREKCLLMPFGSLVGVPFDFWNKSNQLTRAHTKRIFGQWHSLSNVWVTNFTCAQYTQFFQVQAQLCEI